MVLAPTTLATLRRLTESGASAQAIEQARALLPQLEGADRGAVLVELAAACAFSGEFVESLRAAVAASEAYRLAGDTRGLVDALSRMAATLRISGDHASAIRTLEQAEELVRPLGNAAATAQVLRNIGICASLVGRHHQALSCLAEAVDLLGDSTAPSERLIARLSLYNARNRQAAEQSEDAPARHAAHQRLLQDWQALADEARANQLLRVELMALGNLAITLRREGLAEQAIEALNALLPRYREAGMKPNEGLTHAELGWCHEHRADWTAAHESFAAAVQLLQTHGTADDLIDALEGASRTDEALGDTAAALAALKQVRALEKRRSDEAARSAVVQRDLRIELARLTHQWARQATQDPLTGLGNRRALEAWLAEHLPRVEDGETPSIVLMDLDHFKQINDRFGHGCGDEVLRRVATLLQQRLRASDAAIRYGGEEFVLALANMPLDASAALAERVRESVAAQPWQQVTEGLQVTVSLGVALANEADSAQALMTLADRRLYAAKYSGRNRVVAAD